jgi:anionic cell wall polymer biosynthesis LytR-Cps2A-Psr (LCP) family protein
MDGQTALEYARSRHAGGVEGTDFARSQRQQKVITAFKDKIFSTKTLTNPSALLEIAASLGESFSTDLPADEASTAFKLAEEVQTDAIKTYSLDDRSDPGGLLYSPPMAQYGGAYVLVPKSGSFDEIREFTQQIFSSAGYQEATSSAEPLEE